MRELAARGSGGAHSVLQANQAEPNRRGERGDVYSTVYRRPAALGSAARSENRGADQQAAMPESCDCFLRQRPYYILCLPKLPDLPFTRPPALRALHSHCLFEYYYIYILLQELMALRKGTPTLLALARSSKLLQTRAALNDTEKNTMSLTQKVACALLRILYSNGGGGGGTPAAAQPA